jgi:hypothetical protein
VAVTVAVSGKGLKPLGHISNNFDKSVEDYREKYRNILKVQDSILPFLGITCLSFHYYKLSHEIDTCPQWQSHQMENG